MFYGILISIYFYDDGKHNLPHIHAEYGEHEASIAIDDGAVLRGCLKNAQPTAAGNFQTPSVSGNLPRSKLKLVQAWIEIHREDLLANWKLAVAGEPVFRIESLR
uniref:DUF4160 domain-containing protein n=1 Tax=Candidatus Kentrum sp. UNK TaxID=2126344 RepID=A0A451AIC8_9GAMM|nr:MAG: protein of unknown function (DUF4160) [Candidatus Kentron sp. UNK]VFK71556.1 MAG: protein of unknown function (DUF4160) [Candidatus Kentron sp. UNK]